MEKKRAVDSPRRSSSCSSVLRTTPSTVSSMAAAVNMVVVTKKSGYFRAIFMSEMRFASYHKLG